MWFFFFFSILKKTREVFSWLFFQIMEEKWTKPNIHGTCPICQAWCWSAPSSYNKSKTSIPQRRKERLEKIGWVHRDTAEMWTQICPTIRSFSGFSWPPFCYFAHNPIVFMRKIGCSQESLASSRTEVVTLSTWSTHAVSCSFAVEYTQGFLFL